ncbi:MAG: endolytic transglycosylase MltG [Eubacteriales bacterium]|nr:endolytic transglycosylase MltG [Eubacteriales bacterium]
MRKKRSAAFWIGTAAVRILLLALVVFGLWNLGQKAYTFGYRVFAQKSVSAPPGKNVSVTITEGMDAAELGKLLESKRLIQDAKVFQVQMSLSKYKDDLKPGTYILNTSQTADEMLAVLAGEAETESEL